MEIGLLAALLGGALALLSPCGALLLPAFFAATVGSRGTLLAHAAVFYLGMALLLVPSAWAPRPSARSWRPTAAR